MRNKKLISLVCALAMIFTMFSAFTVVRADETTDAIALTSSLSEDGKTITIDAKATEITKVDNFTVNINIPEGVTKDDISVSPAYGSNVLSDGTFSVAYSDTTGGKELEDGELVTITITLSSPLSADYVCTLVGKSAIKEAGATSYKISAGNLTAATTTVSKWVDPNQKSDKVARPAEDTSSDATTTVPEPVEPAEGEKGIALDASLNSTNDVVTIVAKATEITKVDNFTVNINIPEGVTKDDISVSPAYGSNILSDGTFSVAYSDTTGGKELENGELVTITINLSEPLTDAYAFTLVGKSAIKEAGASSYKISAGTLTASSAVVTPTVAEKTTVKTAPLKDYMGVDKSDNNKTAAEVAAAQEEAGNGDKLYLTVDVKKTVDGAETAAVYGDDYVAEYPEGTVLTEKEYNNLIHGYTSAKISDVINGLKFRIYNNEVSSIATTLNSTDSDTQLVNDPDSTDVSYGEETVTYTSLRLSAEKGTVTVDSTTTFTATVTNPVNGGKIKVEYTNPTDKKVIASATPADETATSTKITVKSGSDTGTGTITVSYVDANDVAVTGSNGKALTKTYTLKVKKDTDNDSSSSSSSSSSTSGSRPIANGTNTVTTTNTPTSFTDLDQASWAKEAIVGLAAKGIVSGRGDGTFDPNANITRAEYCQILIGAIEKTNESADVSFDDVATDAWYYHAVAVASKLGIVSGYGDGNFGPNNLITRQDMALMTYKAALATGTSVAATRTLVFGDSAEISDYAAEAVQTLANAGIISGMSDDEFAPKANATRAQASVIIYNTFVK